MYDIKILFSNKFTFMSKASENKSEKIIYENLAPLSSVDAIRVGVQEERKLVVSKNSKVINIDVRKQLTVEMVENLIGNLQSCLDDIKEL